MRAGRLLSMLMLLQTRGRLSATALAAELEVSVRTILRDIDHLSAAGVPVYAERGRDGGFCLSAGWSTELTGLTESEAQALLLAGLPAAATELGLGNAAASARLKVLAAVPTALREDAQRVASRLHIDPVDWYRAAATPEHLQSVAHAVWHQRELSIHYESWAGRKQRIIKPLGMVLKAGNWYVVASPEATGAKQRCDPRTYRLSNIRQLQETGRSFRYPQGFRLADCWRTQTRRFEQEIHTDTATLRVTARGLHWLQEISSPVCEAAARSATPDASNPVWQHVRVPIESIEHAARQFLGLGADAQVLAPEPLRVHMRNAILAMAATYPAEP
ncbi:MAG: helix-turn-helix transcriptional regulator [Pseudomarimonas sp.]